MAYSIGGKMYTDHALMDEVTYATKIILNEIILKNEKKANENETEESMIESDILLAIDNGSARLSFLPLNEEILINFGYTYAQAKLIQGEFDERTQTYHNNLVYVPEEDKDALFEYASKWFVEHYEEKNNYYRMLNGLPEYGTKDYFIYINKSKYPNIPDLSVLVDLSKPVHKFTNTEINTIDSLGILDDIKKQYKGPHYKYLYHLGATKIDIILARKAKIWDILYIPAVEYLVSSRFQELFQINRDMYYRYTHQLAYEYNSDYYDEMMMFLILCQTFSDIITDLPEWYIRRDVFDLRTCQYFLESQGVKFFKEIPLKFQIRIVKNLNKLIRYKSTTKNIHDILEIFGMEGTTVYKYYIYKKLVKKDVKLDPTINGDDEWVMPGTPFEFGDEGEYGGEPIPPSAEESITCLDHAVSDEYEYNPDGSITIKFYEFNDESANEVEDSSVNDYKEDQKESRKTYVDEYGNTYDLEFIKVPIDESYDKYIRNNLYKEDYDTVTSQDQYWDGEDVHHYVKNLHMEKDFTIEGTKYMFLDNRVSMKEYSYQMSYFLNLIFSSKIDTDNIVIKVPSIKSNAEFSITNLCILLYVLSQAYTDHSLDIKYPSEHRTEDKGEFSKYEDFDGGSPLSSSFYDVDGGYMNKIIDNYDPAKPEYDINGHIIRPIMHTLGPYYNEKYRWNVNGGFTAFFTEFTELTLLYWIKMYGYELFNNDLDHPTLYGFNMDADLDKIAIDISLRHSSFLFDHGFTLEDFGVEDFITAKQIDTIDDLIEVYRTNTKAYDNLYNKIVYENDTEDKMIVMQYIFRNLFTIPYDKDFYKLKGGEYANDYGELLRQRDYTLFKFYSQIMSEKDEETKKDNLRLALNEITDTLEFYIKADDTKWVFSFVPTNSLEAVNTYISLMINFFKSWKVYFLDPHVTYALDSRLENKIFMNDTIIEYKEKWWYYDKEIMQDALLAIDKYFITDTDASFKQEIVDIYGYTQWFAVDDIDFDGLYADSDTAPVPFTEDWDIVSGTDSVHDADLEYILLGGDAYNGIMNEDIILNGGDSEYVSYYEDEFIIQTMGAADREASYVYYGLDATMETIDTDIFNGGDAEMIVLVDLLVAGEATPKEVTTIYNGLGSYELPVDDWIMGGDADDSDLPKIENPTVYNTTGLKVYVPRYPDSISYYVIDVSKDYNILYGGSSLEDVETIIEILYGGRSTDAGTVISEIEYGGNAQTDFKEKIDIYEFRNLNGGKVSQVDSSPYWMINGGVVSAMKEVYDLDGGGATNALDCLEVNGLHILIDKGNYWPIDPASSETVSFEVNGGWVNQDVTKGRSIINTIKGHSIKNELLISSYPKNSIELYEDGVYLDGENLVYLTDVEELRYQIIHDREVYEEDLNNCLKIVRMLNDPEVLEQVIDDLFTDYFAVSTELLDYYLSGKLLQEAIGNISTEVAELKNWFVELDVFGWEYF